MIRNLSFDTEEDGLTKLFSDCGKITRVFVPTDRETGKAKGFAFIDFESEDEAKSALKFNETEIDGRTVEISYARPKQEGGSRGRGGSRGGGFRGSRGGSRGGNRGGDRDYRGGNRDFRGGNRKRYD